MNQFIPGITFTKITAVKDETSLNVCAPSPCGPNSQCKEVNTQAVCSCLPSYMGSPPGCRPECTVSSECSSNLSCMNQKCVDPCPGSCGLNAVCRIVNHSPICSCNPGHTGDPFTRCFSIPRKIIIILDKNVLLIICVHSSFDRNHKTNNNKSMRPFTLWPL